MGFFTTSPRIPDLNFLQDLYDRESPHHHALKEAGGNFLAAMNGWVEISPNALPDSLHERFMTIVNGETDYPQIFLTKPNRYAILLTGLSGWADCLLNRRYRVPADLAEIFLQSGEFARDVALMEQRQWTDWGDYWALLSRAIERIQQDAPSARTMTLSELRACARTLLAQFGDKDFSFHAANRTERRAHDKIVDIAVII